jgi:hypothetical protein
MIFHQQLREFLKDHPDLTDLTEDDLEKFETTCSSEEQDQRKRPQPVATITSSFSQLPLPI